MARRPKSLMDKIKTVAKADDVRCILAGPHQVKKMVAGFIREEAEILASTIKPGQTLVLYVCWPAPAKAGE